MAKEAWATAELFVLQAICEWGQPDAERIAAVQGVLDAAGFDATATCWPVFGGIWPRSCAGKDGNAAHTFLKNITDTMPRGKFENETEHVAACIKRATSPESSGDAPTSIESKST